MPTGSAFYDPDIDTAVCPTREQYSTIGDYYCTIFHELTHSTGHETRLNRPALKNGAAASGAAASGATRSAEELCAEIGAAYLCGVAGIDDHELTAKSADYLKGWIEYLSDHKKDFAIAAAQAEKAVNFILEKSAAE